MAGFDETPKDPKVQKVNLKKPSQPSIFDNMVKKPSQQDFDKQVAVVSAQQNQYKYRAAEHLASYIKVMQDKTLPQNKNVISNSFEGDLIKNMVRLAKEVDNDPNEELVSEGSLGLITILLSVNLSQRNQLNNLEYNNLQLEKKINSLIEEIKKISPPLDNKKSND